MNNWTLLLLFLPHFIHVHCVLDAYYINFPSAKLLSSWQNNPSNEKGSSQFEFGCTLRPILQVYDNSTPNPPMGLGFFRNLTSSIDPTAKSSFLVVFMLTDFSFVKDRNVSASSPRSSSPRIVWSANRDKPVGENATLDFTAQGDLVLKDADGSLVWSTNTSAYNVVRMEITVGGCLVLLNDTNGVVWKSFDHPTDTWLPNQNIYSGQRLIARSSFSNLSSGIYYLSVIEHGLMRAFLDSNPPKEYAAFEGIQSVSTDGSKVTIDRFENYIQFTFNSTDYFPYVVLEPTGHLKYHEAIRPYFVEEQEVDFLENYSNADDMTDDCSYPAVCGHHGICSDSGQCLCPKEDNSKYYFRPYEPNVGCVEITPLSCKGDSESHHTFVKLTNFTYFDFNPTIFNTTAEKCKEECMSNCSCKAALFRWNVSSGYCSLQSDELYSFKPNNHKDWGSYTFIKVQEEKNRKKPAYLVPVLVTFLLCGVVFVTFVAGRCYQHRRYTLINAEEERDDQVTEMLTKFSFEELKSCTLNFQIKLGQGGFGTVFEGVLCDGTKVAVKWLDSVGQGRKEFLAEVNTIGRVDHFNIVRLIGYCVEKTNRLLVYEHMCNGSLDRWIFNQDNAQTLDWSIRQKILYGVAKGLEYLHEECRRNIIHFDIKPQNILLDGDFNAKISDFGLAKLIDRNQSLVLTGLKGTPGYVAPELFGGLNISVKADVYSFGIVIMETVCGRKNLDSSKSMPLITIIKEKVEEDQLYDLMDERIEYIGCQKEEATKMLKMGVWCLQTHDKRPSVSLVVKALEGSANIDHLITINEFDSLVQVNPNISTPPEASILSGPR